MTTSDDAGAKHWKRFLIPSAIGVLFFLTPLYVDGQLTIGMAIVGDIFIDNWKPQLSQLAAFFITLSLILTLSFALFKGFRERYSWLSEQLTLHPFWFTMRALGCLFALAYVSGIGPQWMIGEGTAGTTLGNLIPITMTYLAIATVFLPLLTEFGLMELVGILFSRFFDRVFNLPGRSAIDALASWMGSGPVGVFITSQQYERGFYTAREAAVICTNFSVVSVSFSLVVIDAIGLAHLFAPYYLSIIVIGFIAALVTPRLPPLSRLPDRFINGEESKGDRSFAGDNSLWDAAITEALSKAARAPKPKELVVRIGKNISEIWLSLIPVVMGLGTVALILAEYSPLFGWLGAPLVPLLNLFGLAEVEQAAPLMLVGFTDMFLPALVGASIESELTRFVVATVSISQLIYMSEVGALIVKSRIPLNFLDVAIIFLWRTLISLPIAVGVGHLLL